MLSDAFRDCKPGINIRRTVNCSILNGDRRPSKNCESNNTSMLRRICIRIRAFWAACDNFGLTISINLQILGYVSPSHITILLTVTINAYKLGFNRGVDIFVSLLVIWFTLFFHVPQRDHNLLSNIFSNIWLIHKLFHFLVMVIFNNPLIDADNIFNVIKHHMRHKA